MDKNDVTKDYLYNAYVTEKKSLKEISEETGISASLLQSMLYTYNIYREGSCRRMFDKDLLIDLLVNQRKNKSQVCKILDTDIRTLSKNISIYNIEIPKDFDEDEIVRLYVEENKTMEEIVDIVKTRKYSTINRILHKHGVDIRDGGRIEGREYEKFEPLNKKYVNESDIDEIKEMYRNGDPIIEISNKFNTSRGAIERLAEELNLVREKSPFAREQYDNSRDEEILNLYNSGKSSVEIGKILGIGHRTVQNHIIRAGGKLRTISESLFVKNDKSFPEELAEYDSFYDLYVIKRMSKKELSLLYNVSSNVLNRLLKEYGIHRRGPSEALKGIMVGENHPNWKGGPKELTSAVRNYITYNVSPKVLKRDKHRCQYPGCNCRKPLHVHHIRKFSDIYWEIISEHPDLNPDDNIKELYEIMINDPRINDMNNLITYCKDCHLYKVHEFKKSKVDDASINNQQTKTQVQLF